MPRSITVVFRDDSNMFDVHEGDRYADHLCWDEMLGQIAQLTHPSINKERYQMLTQEEHDAKAARHAQRMAELHNKGEQHAE